MSGIDFDSKDALSAVGAIALAGVGWLWRQISSKVSRRELKAYMEQHERQFERMLERFDAAEKDNKDARTEIYDSLRIAAENQANTNVAVASALGALQGALEERRTTRRR